MYVQIAVVKKVTGKKIAIFNTIYDLLIINLP